MDGTPVGSHLYPQVLGAVPVAANVASGRKK